MASPRISPHASKPRLLMTMIEPPFAAAGDEREEQVGGLALQREVADLVETSRL
jgi:hypothetical protein